jgi:hypothetical protein
MAQQAVVPLKQPSQGWVIYRLPALVGVAAVVLVISLLIFILSTLVGLRYVQVFTNPLSAYTDIFPGQPVSALEAYTCATVAPAGRPASTNPSQVMCGLYPEDGPFHLIHVKTHEAQIVEVTFYSGVLEPELMFAFWGEPDDMQRGASGRTFRLKWDNVMYATTVMVMQPERLVQLIRLEAKS